MTLDIFIQLCKWRFVQGFHIPLCLKGCAMSGLIADAKTLIDKARVETQVQILCATIT